MVSHDADGPLGLQNDARACSYPPHNQSPVAYRLREAHADQHFRIMRMVRALFFSVALQRAGEKTQGSRVYE